jgi:uroporphyrinogen decarboxylase
MISQAGRNKATVNYLQTIYFDHPQWTPCAIGFLPATWIRYGADLEELVLSHPRVFPQFRKGSVDFRFGKMGNPLYELGRHTDCWGVVWDNIQRGLDSQPVGHPLADWSDFEQWKRRRPDPLTDDWWGPRNWQATREAMEAAKARGDLAAGGGLAHGFFFMNLYYLRGFEDLMLDFATGEPLLDELIAVLRDYCVGVVSEYLRLGAEIMYFGEDLGMQTALPISPAMWRKHVKPVYESIMGPCRDRGVPVYLHSDGHILEIIGDLIDTGVRIINPQIRANGLAGLQEHARGKVAINQDLDRQLFPFATPSQIEDHIGEVFEGLYLPAGGLMLLAECGPDVPLASIDAICRTFERLCELPDPPQ